MSGCATLTVAGKRDALVLVAEASTANDYEGRDRYVARADLPVPVCCGLVEVAVTADHCSTWGSGPVFALSADPPHGG